MNTAEMIDFLREDIEEDAVFLKKGIADRDFDQVMRSGSSTIKSFFGLGLLHWRMKLDPNSYFTRVVKVTQEITNILETIDPVDAKIYPLDFDLTMYSAYLIGVPHSPINLELKVVNEHIKASAFFGNVLIGAADIADWPKYRDAIPAESRYDLARRSNELYADLLAGRISPEKGVPLGEKLWEEREDNDYFQGGGSGGGNENHQIVDYQLGAILKKIGSTVPTIHAWVW